MMETARKVRVPTSHIPAEDIVERALENGILTHVSDGPSGEIFTLEADREDVITCLVDEMNGGWELLGVGKAGSEGMVFLKHPCGFGSEEKEEKREGKGKQKAGPRVGGEAEWNRESVAGRNERRERDANEAGWKGLLHAARNIPPR